MSAKVVFTGDFRSDLQAQTRWLLSGERPEWAVRLVTEVELAAERLRQSPEAGPAMRRGTREIRHLLLRKLPFVLWYHWQKRGRKVVVLRLFYVRQKRLQ